MMSINAVKGVEIGDGFAVAGQFGHETRDELTSHGFLANHAGGILGGISSGQTIRVAIALKPTASITTPGKTINLNREDTDVLTKGRHDPCGRSSNSDCRSNVSDSSNGSFLTPPCSKRGCCSSICANRTIVSSNQRI